MLTGTVVARHHASVSGLAFRRRGTDSSRRKRLAHVSSPCWWKAASGVSAIGSVHLLLVWGAGCAALGVADGGAVPAGHVLRRRVRRRAGSDQRATLLVRPDNEPARPAYLRWGWHTLGEIQPFPNSPRYDALSGAVARPAGRGGRRGHGQCPQVRHRAHQAGVNVRRTPGVSFQESTTPRTARDPRHAHHRTIVRLRRPFRVDGQPSGFL